MEPASANIIPPPLASFLKSGKRELIDDQALAAMITDSSIQLTQTSVPAALRFSQKLVDRSRSLSGPIPLASWRSLGRATLMASKYKEAAKAYSHARRLADGDPLSQGRIDRTLIDVHMYLGDFDKAEQCAQVARRIFTRLQDKAELAKVNVNLANLYHRQDRHADAAKLYAQAREYFVSAGDKLATARCSYNLANTFVQLFRFDEAEVLYEQCYQVYRDAEFHLDALDARWGVAWLHILQGKYHVALRELQECDDGYRTFGRPLRVATCALDRAEIYLQLALYSDARLAAIRAEQLSSQLKLRYETAKATLFRAFASVALHDRADALASVRRAERLFDQDDNTGFRGAVELLKADLASSAAASRKTLQKALAHFRKGQLPLWSAIADLRAVQDEKLAISSLRRLKSDRLVHQMPQMYAAWQTTLGDRAEKSGKRLSALRHWRQAARRLDEVRAQLPPLGMRQAVQKSTFTQPHPRLIAALARKNPTESLLWAERFKTSGLWQPLLSASSVDPNRQRVVTSLEVLAAEVARLNTSLYAGGERSMAAAPSYRRLKTMEQQVRAELVRVEKGSSIDHFTEEELLADYYRAAATQVVIHWHCAESDLIALIVEGKSVRSVVIPNGRTAARRFSAHLSFMLESASLATNHGLSHDLRAEQQLLSQGAELLWKPLGLRAGDRRILVIAEGELANLPWAAMRQDDQSLLKTHTFLHATSIRHWAQSHDRTVSAKNVSVLVGRRADLPAIGAELEVIRECFPSARVYDPAIRSDMHQLESGRIWHYAGHAIINAENPFYSRLELADGPLFAADLRLRSVNVDLVTLAACRSAEETAIPGDESTGFVRSFLEMGARNVIAGHWAVADGSTSLWMTEFYRLVSAGKSYLESTHLASLRLAGEDISCYHWAAFSLYGAGS